MFRFSTLIFALLALASLARADFLEKMATGGYVGVTAGQTMGGKVKQKAMIASQPTGSENAYAFSGLRLGLQAGLVINGFVVGGEYSGSAIKGDFKSSDGVTEFKDRSWSMGQQTAFISYRGWKLVPWVGFTFDGTFTDDTRKLEASGGSGFVAGIGFRVFQYLQVNVEARSYTFSKQKLEPGSEEKLPTTTLDRLEGSETFVSLTIPFEVGKGIIKSK